MNTLFSLIANNHKINIYIPEVESKNNWYREPSERLDKFDEITVIYTHNAMNYILSIDPIDTVLYELTYTLKKTLNNESPLPEYIKKGEMGKAYNKNTYELLNGDKEKAKREDIFGFYWLFSSQNIQTWIYNFNNTIYIEMSPTYKWLYEDPTEEDFYISFEDFIHTYEPLVVISINKKKALEWKKTCDSFIEIINKNDELYHTEMNK